MRKKNRNKLAEIVTSTILILVTSSLPSYALNEYSVAGVPKESETQTSQTTRENRKPLINKTRSSKRRPNRTTKAQSRRVKVLQSTTRLDSQPLPQPDQPGDCGRWVWNPIREEWVYVKVPCP